MQKYSGVWVSQNKLRGSLKEKGKADEIELDWIKLSWSQVLWKMKGFSAKLKCTKIKIGTAIRLVSSKCTSHSCNHVTYIAFQKPYELYGKEENLIWKNVPCTLLRKVLQGLKFYWFAQFNVIDAADYVLLKNCLFHEQSS